MEAEHGMMCMDADGIFIKHLELKTTQVPAITFYSAKNVEIQGLALANSTKPMILISCDNTKKVNIDLIEQSKAEKVLLLGNHVDHHEIHLKYK